MCRPSIIVTFLLLLLGLYRKVQAYSVLTRQALIDAAWEMSIRPLLVKRFPKATNNEMRQAHGFAYGGSIMQDIGYYPHSSHFFSDLLHYVRGDGFITAMIRDSRDLNEYAFALGSLAHYAANKTTRPPHRGEILRCRCSIRSCRSNTATSSPMKTIQLRT